MYFAFLQCSWYIIFCIILLSYLRKLSRNLIFIVNIFKTLDISLFKYLPCNEWKAPLMRDFMIWSWHFIKRSLNFRYRCFESCSIESWRRTATIRLARNLNGSDNFRNKDYKLCSKYLALFKSLPHKGDDSNTFINV